MPTIAKIVKLTLMTIIPDDTTPMKLKQSHTEGEDSHLAINTLLSIC